MITRPALERRQQPRICLEDRAKVHILTPRQRPAGLFKDFTAEGHLFDLNNLGAYVATDLDLRKGLTIDILIDLPGMKIPEQVSALVARRAGRLQLHDRIIPEGLGLRFIAETSKEQERIRKIVMIILALDLLKYGYETRRTIRFWRDVLANSPISFSDLETEPYSQNDNLTNTDIILPDSVGQNLLETYSREQVGLSPQKFPE